MMLQSAQRRRTDEGRLHTLHHGIALEPDWETAVAGADAVLILAGHDAFAAIGARDFARLAPGALIYDGRIYYPPGKIAELEAAGLAYMGVGR